MLFFQSIYKLKLGLLACSLLIFHVSCETDYYESEEKIDPANSLFEEGVQVSPEFDWATTQVVQIDIAVDDRYNGQYYYQIDLYDINPIFSKNASPLATGVAKQNANYKTSISIPRSVSLLYVRQQDPTGKSVVTSATIENNALIVRFNSEQEIQTGNLRSGMSLYNSSSLTTEYTTPVDAIEITNEKQGNSFVLDPNTTGTSKSCVIKKGTTYTGSLSFSGWDQGVSLYVEGTWINTSSDIRLGNGDKIVIQGGGKMLSQKDLSIGASNTSIIAIAPSGEIDVIKPYKLSLEFYDKGQLINGGVFKAHSVSIPSLGQFYNYGEAQVDKVTLRSKGVVTNNSKLSIADLVIDNGIVINDCNLIVEKAITNGAEIFLNEGSLFTVKQSMTSGGTIFSFESDAMMDAEQILFTTQLNEIKGVGDKFSLARLNNIILENPNSQCVYYKGKVEIEWISQTESILNHIIHPARFLEKSGEKSSHVIVATSCNGGGNNPSPGNLPGDVRFPIISKGQGLTYLFEDNWPYLGDYDMNDLVVDIAPVYLKNKNNEVESMTLRIDLRAVGATKRLAVGIQLEEVEKSNVTVSRSTNDGLSGQVFELINGLEAGQDKPVIPVFDDVHGALGLSSPQITNTTKGNEKKATKSVTISVSFNTPVKESSLTIDKLNVFAVNGGAKNKRSEIHLLGFSATQKADKSKFGQGSDNSMGGVTYRSNDNLIWALAIPSSSCYSLEWQRITSVFSQFETWVLSAGKSNEDWYKYPEEGTFMQ